MVAWDFKKNQARNELGKIDPIVNSGPGKFYPDGLTFQFDGVKIVCLVHLRAGALQWGSLLKFWNILTGKIYFLEHLVAPPLSFLLMVTKHGLTQSLLTISTAAIID